MTTAKRFREKIARALAWRIGVAVVGIAGIMLTVAMRSDDSPSPSSSVSLSEQVKIVVPRTSRPRSDGTGVALFLVLLIGGIAGVVHTWRSARRLVVFDDGIEIDGRRFSARGLSFELRRGVRDEYERHPPMDALRIEATDERGKVHTSMLISRDWPDVGAIEAALLELTERAPRPGYR